MEPEQIPLNVNNVNRSPFVIQEQDVVQGQRRNQIEHFQVNEIVECVDLGISTRSCSFLMCAARAQYKCKLVVSGHYHYCYKCYKCYKPMLWCVRRTPQSQRVRSVYMVIYH